MTNKTESKRILAAAQRAAAKDDHATAAALFASVGVSYVAVTRTEARISAHMTTSPQKPAKQPKSGVSVKGDAAPAADHGLLPKTASNPTSEQYSAYQAAFDYFNRALFGGQLKPVVLNFSRKAKSLGFFAPERWGKPGADEAREVRHEISLNPMYLAARPARETMSTLVHEMCHLWQRDFGKPSRGGYHDREWGSKMESVGLMPSNTGMPGGKRTGDKMTHYIIEGGAFAKAFESIPAEYLLPWTCAEPDEEKKPRTNSKVKFTCPGCEASAWGKPTLKIVCGECEEEMEAVS